MSTFSRVAIAFGVIALLVLSVIGVEPIDAGHVGVKVNLIGTGKGVDNATEVTGWVFYNRFTTKVVEFPTFIRHKEYKKEGEIDESFVINSKDGSEFHVSPLLNYSVKREKVPYIFTKYRVELDQIEQGFLKTAVYDAFRVVANSYTADELISNRELFENKVRLNLEKHLTPEGFILAQFTSNLIYPETFKRAIEAKNNAVQTALTAENQVKTAEAQARIKVATAEGNAQAMLTSAKAEAESNRLRQQTLTPMLLQQMWVEKWNGELPSTVLGQGSNTFYGLNK
jgi:regulator of protease activity HflC (stomatin/prohibitin superfamily)